MELKNILIIVFFIGLVILGVLLWTRREKKEEKYNLFYMVDNDTGEPFGSRKWTKREYVSNRRRRVPIGIQFAY